MHPLHNVSNSKLKLTIKQVEKLNWMLQTYLFTFRYKTSWFQFDVKNRESCRKIIYNYTWAYEITASLNWIVNSVSYMWSTMVISLFRFSIFLLNLKGFVAILSCVFSTLNWLTLTPKTHFVQFYLKVTFYFLFWGKNKYITLGMRL